MLALSGDGRTAYTSNVGAGTVSVIDVATKKVTAMVTVAARAQRIALSPDGRFLIMALPGLNQVGVLDSKSMEDGLAWAAHL